MGRLILFILVLLFISSSDTFAQKRVTGPEAKFKGINKVEKKSTFLYVKDHNHPSIKGPEAKNKSSLSDECNSLVVKVSTRRNLKGPKAKNTRPEDKEYWIKEEDN